MARKHIKMRMAISKIARVERLGKTVGYLLYEVGKITVIICSRTRMKDRHDLTRVHCYFHPGTRVARQKGTQVPKIWTTKISPDDDERSCRIPACYLCCSFLLQHNYLIYLRAMKISNQRRKSASTWGSNIRRQHCCWRPSWTFRTAQYSYEEFRIIWTKYSPSWIGSQFGCQISTLIFRDSVTML